MPKSRTLLPLRALRCALAALALCLLSPVFAAMLVTEASAHATLIAAEPADNAVVEQSPARLVMRFSEPVKVMSLTLAAPNGTTVPLPKPSVSEGIVTIDGVAELSKGTHALRYRIVSADGHPVGGSVLFSVGEATGAPGRGDAPDWPVAALVFVSKLFLYLGLFLGVGGAAYGAGFGAPEPAAKRVIGTLLVIGLIAMPFALGAQGLDALGAPITRFFLPDVWAAGAETAFSRTLLLAGLAFVAASAGLRLGTGIAARALAGLALVLLGSSLAVAGHASNAPPQWATRPAVFLHAVAIAVWLGSLLPLAIAIQQGRAEGLAALKRFSAAIPYVLVPLIASGILLGIVQVREPAALFDTSYGLVFVVKLALVALLLLLAAANRWSLTPAVAAAKDPSVRERMVGVIGMELALALLILAAVTLWRFTPPPRALQEAAAQPAIAHLVTGPLTADLSVTPGHPGAVAVSAAFATIDYVPVAPSAVTFEFSNPARAGETIRMSAAKPGDGLWTATGALPVGGRWRVRVDVTPIGAAPTVIEGTIDLREK